MKNAIDIPGPFRKQALAMPDAIRKAIAEGKLDEPSDGADMIDQLDTARRHAARIGADIEIQNSLFDATLQVICHVGKILSAYRGKQGVKKSSTGVLDFSGACSQSGIGESVGLELFS